MPPEAILLVVNALIVAFAYLAAYPLLKVRTLDRLMVYDAVLTIAALVVAGGLYAGTGVRFSLLLLEVNWFLFAILTYGLLELWPMRAYMRRHDIRLPGPDADD